MVRNASFSRKSLAAHVAEEVRKEIARGHWHGHLPAERRLCVQLGVSRPTLRKALALLRSRGQLEIAHGRSTKLIGRAAREPASGGSNLVLALTPEPLDRLPGSVVYTFDDLRGNLAEMGMRLEVRTVRLPRGRPDGVLEPLYAAERPAVSIIYQAERPVHRWFCEHGWPCAVFGTQDAEYPLAAVDMDQRATCRHAAHTLLRAGFRRGQIFLVLPKVPLAGHALMRRGFADALGKAVRVVEAPLEPAAFSAALDRLWEEVTGRTGLIFARASQAAGALGHLAIRRGLRVPQDVALISLADDPFLRHLQPALARYHRDDAWLARQLSALVIRAATGGVLPSRMTLLMPELISGETVQ